MSNECKSSTCCGGTSAEKLPAAKSESTCSSQPPPKRSTPCCGSAPTEQAYANILDHQPWHNGTIETPVGPVPRVRTALTLCDRAGSWKRRWDFGRMNYRIVPGLYGVGNPTKDSPVFVSANYKMSFDHLRSAIPNLDGWILVLDTKGVNVWCAAGKGTFGTAELIERIKQTRLSEVVSHRKLVLPQLGAPGVNSHEVRSQSGFQPVFGPVLAKDIPAFLNARMVATPKMRKVEFGWWDRVILGPEELMGGMKQAIGLSLGIWLLLSIVRVVIDRNLHTPLASILSVFPAFLATFGGFAGASLIGPLLLPWLPGRMFSVKGISLGLLLSTMMAVVLPWSSESGNFWWQLSSFYLLTTAVASYTLMNFTGATTFTSLSGVLRETRRYIPLQISTAVISLLIWSVSFIYA